MSKVYDSRAQLKKQASSKLHGPRWNQTCIKALIEQAANVSTPLDAYDAVASGKVQTFGEAAATH